MYYRSILFLITGLLVGCSSVPVADRAESLKPSAADTLTVRKLYDHYNVWRGVPYQEGGLSKQGVDCSGFVYLAYRNTFNKSSSY